jgi:hypothetical protein
MSFSLFFLRGGGKVRTLGLTNEKKRALVSSSTLDGLCAGGFSLRHMLDNGIGVRTKEVCNVV